MMSGQTLYNERDAIKKNLYRSLDNLHKNGMDWAEKTKAYRVKLAQTILLLKSQGMQISIIDKVAKGQPDVAQLEFEMMTAEVLHKSAQENIMIQKKLFDSIEAEINREWTRKD